MTSSDLLKVAAVRVVVFLHIFLGNDQFCLQILDVRLNDSFGFVQSHLQLNAGIGLQFLVFRTLNQNHQFVVLFFDCFFLFGWCLCESRIVFRKLFKEFIKFARMCLIVVFVFVVRNFGVLVVFLRPVLIFLSQRNIGLQLYLICHGGIFAVISFCGGLLRN